MTINLPDSRVCLLNQLLVLERLNLKRDSPRLEPHVVNGQPGAIFRDRNNNVLNIWALDVLDGRIQAIRTVINPDKLGHVGPVADAWAVIREANQARRPTD